MLSTMEVVLVLSMMVLSTSAVPQLTQYRAVADDYGKELSFQITTDTYYPTRWQRVCGDPHGQVAKEEKPDPLGDETLSFDFPDTVNHWLLLWEHPNHDVKIAGKVIQAQLSEIWVYGPGFKVKFSSSRIGFNAGGSTIRRQYTGTFDDTLHATLGAQLRSVDEHKTVELLFGGYLFRVIAPQGVYNVSGQQELGMSITLWKGDIQDMEGLMGQIDGYKIYSGDNPEHGDHALAVPKIDGVDKAPVLVKKNYHLGRYKTVWHYKYVDQSEPHGIIGDFNDFPFIPY